MARTTVLFDLLLRVNAEESVHRIRAVCARIFIIYYYPMSSFTTAEKPYAERDR